MSHLTNILWKEVKELLTGQMIASMLIMVIFFVIFGSVMGNVQEEAISGKTSIALLDLDGSEESRRLTEIVGLQKNVALTVVSAHRVEEALKLVEDYDSNALLVLPEGFGEKIENMDNADVEIYAIVKGLGIMDTMSSTQAQTAISIINNILAQEYVKKAYPDKEPQSVLNPIIPKNFIFIKGAINEGSPEAIASLLMGQSIIVPVILMIAIMFAGQMVITSMGMEKENKTLETLLTMPVSRGTIILGKIGGAAIMAFIMSIVYLAGFGYYAQSLTPSTSISMPALSMGAIDYALLGISLFLAILVALSLSMLLGVYSQDTKSAQTMILPVTILVVIPFFLLMFSDYTTMPLALRAVMFAIPFSHPMIASRALFFGDYNIVIAGIIYMALFSAILWLITVRVFRSDRVITAKLSLRRRR
ncbi:MAG: ABC transporter permease [Candidatus Thermoplasmatota archaeon]|nr:ABC transporter permease [Candidatus Thermoplasmatota archaeon]